MTAPADFRSDTVTRPSEGMLQAMMTAAVGDDVWGDDPTVNELQQVAADMFGCQAALFCPSGTMTNQIAIKVHTQPGDELICSNTAHILLYEGGGIAFNSGVQAKPIQGDDGGRLSVLQIKNAINLSDDPHYPRTTLVALENTTNKSGGACYSLKAMRQISTLCRERGVRLHLDGARVFNAIVASGGGGIMASQAAEQGLTDKQPQQPKVVDDNLAYGPKDIGSLFDSVSICLSKGLGCPVGSLLLGTQEFMTRARRVRKLFGGGMRQAGFLAAAGLYALRNNVDRLAIDHSRARALHAALSALPPEFVESVGTVSTNIVVFTVAEHVDPQVIAECFRQHGVLISSMGGRVLRLVSHLDITDEHVAKAVEVIRQLPVLLSKAR